MAVTRFGLEGYGVRRAGTFAGKTAGAVPSKIFTRLGFAGYGVRRAGSFAGKTPYTPPATTTTDDNPFFCHVGRLMGHF